MSNLFKYGSEMTKNPSAETIKALVKAVEDIKKILETPAAAATPTTVTPAAVTTGAGAAPITTNKPVASNTAKTSQADIMVQLQTTLSQINMTLKNLPASIAQIEIKVPER